MSEAPAPIVSEKLVRDLMPDWCERKASEGATPMRYRIASEGEMPDLLLKKLAEEVNELRLAHAENNVQGVVEELSDIADVIAAFVYRLGITEEQLMEVNLQKTTERGEFERGVVWDGTY